MRKTPQYLLTFYQSGDLYSAADDLDRNTVMDNQMYALSQIAGDGVLYGWGITALSGLVVNVAPGSGLITSVAHQTFSDDQVTIFDNTTTQVYMKSLMFGGTGSFPLSIEGPASLIADATYIKTTPDAAPTNFSAIASSFDSIALTWDMNQDGDFSHYDIDQDVSPSFPTPVRIASPTVNGTTSAPFEATGLTGSMTYYFRIRTVDTTGNPSAWVSISAMTQADNRTVPDVLNLTALVGNGGVSIAFTSPGSFNLQSYVVTVVIVLSDGTISPVQPSYTIYDDSGAPAAGESLSETYQILGLTNNTRYRVRVQSRALSDDGATPPGNLSLGAYVDVIPTRSNAPLDVIGPSSVSQDAAVQLSWAASPSPSVTVSYAVVGLKNNYLITVSLPGGETAPQNVGLALSKTLASYTNTASVGQGSVVQFVESQTYLFVIRTADAFGNLSGGVYIKGSTLPVTPPANPGLFAASAGDTQVLLTWNSSMSDFVTGYLISYSLDNGATYTSETNVGTVTSYLVTGLPNGGPITFKIRTINKFGNTSSGAYVVGVPVFNTTPPAVPAGIRANPEDSQVRLTWNPNSEATFSYYIVRRQVIANPQSTSPNAALIVLSESTFNLGAYTEFLDIGLTNGTSYAYAIQAVDTNGNMSAFSGTYITSPDSGINSGGDELDAPTSLSAVFDPVGVQIVLSWDYSFPGQVFDPVSMTFSYPTGNGPTAFNIYRSAFPTGGFALVRSIPAGLRNYSDTNLIGNTTYYYYVSVDRDSAAAVADTGSVQPANSVLLGSVIAQGGAIVSITNSPRICAGLSSTVSEITLAKLLAHRHLTQPINSMATATLPSLSMADANDIITACFASSSSSAKAVAATLGVTVAQPTSTNPAESAFSCAGGLSDDAIALYQSVGVASVTNGTDGIMYTYNSYPAHTTYVINPSQLIGEVPYVGDFQVLVNGLLPTAEYSFNTYINAVVFATALAASDLVTIAGLGLTYYVPAVLSSDSGRGYQVIVDGSLSNDAQVDETTQTVRFPTALAASSMVTVVIEPVVPDFDNEQGARQVNLSPDFVLSDFTAQTLSYYQSASGNFATGDVVTVLVNGVPTQASNYVDFINKAVVFSSDLAYGSIVSLLISDRPEVQGTLPSTAVAGFDGSRFTTGTLLKAQIAGLDHEGRIQEATLPVFTVLTSTDNYVFPASGGVGTATTPYDLFQFGDGNFILGTSSGFLKTYFVPGLLLSSGDSVSISGSLPTGGGVGLNFDEDEIVNVTQTAVMDSGRIVGVINIATVYVFNNNNMPENLYIKNPSVGKLDDGTIFISGGMIGFDSGTSPTVSNRCFIYDPVPKTAKEVAPMTWPRTDHACAVLPDNNVFVCGGLRAAVTSQVCAYDADFDSEYGSGANPLTGGNGIIGSWYLKTAEMFDPSFGQNGLWTEMPPMAQKRTSHAGVVFGSGAPNPSILVAGGVWQHADSGGFTISDSDLCDSADLPVSLYADPPSTIEETYLQSVEIFLTSSNTWSAADIASLTYPAISTGAQSSDNSVVVDTTQARELYDIQANTWTATAAVSSVPTVSGGAVIDGPMKAFLLDENTLNVLAVTKSNIYFTQDEGATWVQMTGLEAVGCVHAVSQSSDGTLFAATDLGVYEITTNISSGNKWFQGGLIGAGTTETFALCPLGAGMLATTEIGVFYTGDDGDTWDSLLSVENAVSVDVSGDTIYVLAGQSLYRSDNAGATWTLVGSYAFIDPFSKVVLRAPLDLFISSASGLYVSPDGVNFSLVSYGLNIDPSTNNVQMLKRIGGDIYVGYDNIVYILDPNLNPIIIAQFTGVVPTVRINGVEARDGFRYDTKNNNVIFETKRLVTDVVDVAVNYSVYNLSGGEWYSQNPDSPVIVYVDRTPVNSGVTWNSRTGQVTFASALQKTDIVTISVADTTLKDGGQYFHSELEDKFANATGGLPLALYKASACAMLQMGLNVEHNFLERGIDRDQYYCLEQSFVDRGFTSFLTNAQFSILGRQDFDSFNSTIDYTLLSQQTDTGMSALAPSCRLEFSLSEVWIGTDSGIFVLNQNDSFSVSAAVAVGQNGGSVRDMVVMPDGSVSAATPFGVFSVVEQAGQLSVTQNAGMGLATTVHSLGFFNGILLAGTEDGVYFADSSQDPAFGTWVRANHVAASTQIPVALTGAVTSIGTTSGFLVAAIGSSVFSSTDGKIWSLVFTFPAPTDPTMAVVVNRIAFFSQKVYLATSQGVYDDQGTIQSKNVVFTLDMIDPISSQVAINDVFATAMVLYAVGDVPAVYSLYNQVWSNEQVNVPSVHQFLQTSSGVNVAISNNTVLTEQ